MKTTQVQFGRLLFAENQYGKKLSDVAPAKAKEIKTAFQSGTPAGDVVDFLDKQGIDVKLTPAWSQHDKLRVSLEFQDTKRGIYPVNKEFDLQTAKPENLALAASTLALELYQHRLDGIRNTLKKLTQL